MFVIDYFDIDNMIQMIIISKIFFLYIRKSYIFPNFWFYLCKVEYEVLFKNILRNTKKIAENKKAIYKSESLSLSPFPSFYYIYVYNIIYIIYT